MGTLEHSKGRNKGQKIILMPKTVQSFYQIAESYSSYLNQKIHVKLNESRTRVTIKYRRYRGHAQDAHGSTIYANFGLWQMISPTLRSI